MSINDTLQVIGINLRDAAAGFAGGVSYVFVMKNLSPLEAIGSIIVGTFTSNYLGEYMGHFFNVGVGASAFLTGLSGMAICQGAIAAAKKVKWGSHGDR